MGIKLNLGGGKQWKMEGWTNLDVSLGYNLDTRMLYDYNPISVDLIYTSHCLEHLPFPKVRELLSDCYFALKLGGRIRIVVPDTEKLWSILRDGDRSVLEESEYYRRHRGNTLEQDVKTQFGFIGSTGHISWYSLGVICNFLAFAGFRPENISESAYGESECSEFQQVATLKEGNTGSSMSGFDSLDHKPISLYVEAVK